MRGVRPFAFLIAGILIGCAPMGPSSTSPQATTPYGFGSGGASLTVTLPARRGIQVLPTTPWDTATVTVISPHLRTNRVQAFGGGSTTLSGINGLPAGPATISVALSTASVTL